MIKYNPAIISNNITLKILGLICMLASSYAYSQNIPQDSVYQLNSTWLDQDANKRTLSSFSGKKQVISLIYTHCLHTCPTIVSTMQAIENKLSETEKQDVGFILVSLTPDTDTPAVLKEFAQSRKLNLQNWSLLTGTPQDVRSLAMVLNIKFQNIDNNEVNHSNLMTGLDEQGRIKFQELGVINNAAIAAEKLTNF
ncbi:SCO family protein [uncultured Pseudoalteromonas sp.]|uniref:SCO family protein n=1 Tax=Pseudoalteromonas TaxID=53246 RepID=UPI0030DA7005|tara:strand:- start:994 stop:1581 length:588 start_codon:yes stop_codon:yes gene_type:complete